MAKGQKRKNAGVGVDFRRVKAKVGKKLPKAQNETDTSFKSRSITLPEQLQDKAGAAVTHRNLTLKELLTQCGHYSDKVRREAVGGLAELIGAHPKELSRHSTLVMETLAERITDGDKAVREALRDALASTILPAMGGAALGPFVPLLMAHVCSAMTHLADQIRADALGFLDLLAGWRPDLVAASFLPPALHHFGDLLSKGSRGRSLSAGSLAALHKVVASLEKFLGRIVTEGGAEGSGSGSVSAGSARGGALSGARRGWEPEAGAGAGAGALPLFGGRCGWPPLAGSGGGGGPGGALAAALPAGGALQGTAATEAAQGGSSAAAEKAARQVLGSLLECWSDCGPAQLATEPELMLAQCLLCTLRSCNHLLARFGTELTGAPSDRASLAHALLRKVAPVFPVQLPAVPPPQPVCEALVEINVAAAQLLTRFLPFQLSPSALAAPAGGGGDEAAGGWPARLLDWFEAVMVLEQGGALPAAGGDGGLFSPGGRNEQQEEQEGQGAGLGASGSGRGRGKGSGGTKGGKQRQRQKHQAALPPEVYEAALEGTWGVLPLVGGPRRRALLGAAWALWERSSVRSAARATVLRFWRRLLADPAGSFCTPMPLSGEPLVLPSEALQWLQAMPRFLWELGPSSPATTESALRLLLDGARYACCDPAALADLQAQLAPLFATLLPARGGKQAQQQRLLPGPLAQQAQHVQALAVDLVWHLPSLAEPSLRTAALLCLTEVYPLETALRLLDVVASKAARECPSSGVTWGAAAAAEGGSPVAGGFGGLLLCLLAGHSTAGVEQAQVGGGWRRHEAVVASACQALLGCGYPGELAKALAPPLLDLCRTSGPARSLYGALMLSTTLAEASASTSTAAAVEAAAAVDPVQLQEEQQVAGEAVGEQMLSAQGVLLPPALAAELPGIMLAYAAACQPTQHEPATAAGAATGSTDAAKKSDESEGEWTPTPSDAAALCLRLLRTLPSALPATLDCLAAALAEQQGTAAGASTTLSSCIAAAWLPQAGGPTDGVQGSKAPQRALAAASWVAASVALLEGILGLQGQAREALLEEEQKVEAALTACDGGVGRLVGEGHALAAGLQLAVERCGALLANLFGRDL